MLEETYGEYTVRTDRNAKDTRTRTRIGNDDNVRDMIARRGGETLWRRGEFTSAFVW